LEIRIIIKNIIIIITKTILLKQKQENKNQNVLHARTVTPITLKFIKYHPKITAPAVKPEDKILIYYNDRL
jgi:hypothetical protein